MKVRELMTADPRTAEPDTTLEEIATMMKEEDVGVIPVVEDGRVTGLVTDRDIVVRCIAVGKDATECTAEDVMSAEVRSVDPESDVDEAGDIMGEAQVRRLPVVKNGKLVGMLSLGDIAVKAGEDEEDTTAETLEEVSQGVKTSGRKQEADAAADDTEEIEVEEEDNELEMAGSGARRGQQNANGRQQNSRGQNSGGGQQQPQSGRKQQGSTGQSSGGRQQQQSGRNQSSSGKQQKEATQGISNRSAKEENARQAKVAPKRADAGGKRNSGGRRAS